MVKTGTAAILSEEQRRVLRRWVRAKTSPQRLVMRARIILMAGSVSPLSEIQREVGVSRPTVTLWKNRFAAGGPEALLHDAKGRGRKRVIPDAKVAQILATTVETQPQGATHWGTRTMVKEGQPLHDTAALVRPWIATPSDGDLQAVYGPALRGENVGRRGPLSPPSRQGSGSVRR
jgi:transposase